MRVRTLLGMTLVTLGICAAMPQAFAQWPNVIVSDPPSVYNHPRLNWRWSWYTARCGDGIRQNFEQCDDGNRVSNDGCSRTCVKENKRAYGCMNGRYLPGENYLAADGCNTCTCQLNGASACTKMACPSIRNRCTSSDQCGADERCTTETGSCLPSCTGMYCTAVCTGVCEKRPQPTRPGCQPYACRDGTAYQACTAGGIPINYFADPCLTHGGQVQALCGNGVCEEGEASYCPACVYGNPACLAPCKTGSCTRDCR